MQAVIHSKSTYLLLSGFITWNEFDNFQSQKQLQNGCIGCGQVKIGVDMLRMVIMPISHHATQPPYPAPLSLSESNHWPSCLSVIMPINQPPCSPLYAQQPSFYLASCSSSIRNLRFQNCSFSFSIVKVTLHRITNVRQLVSLSVSLSIINS